MFRILLPSNVNKVASLSTHIYIPKQHTHTRIGCASGFWGDSPTAVPQLLQHGNIDFIMLDYLSEVTMSLLTSAKAAKPDLGYAPDFVHHAMRPNLQAIKNKGVRIISNSGGINPKGCAAALKRECILAGVDLKIGVVTGDDMMAEKYLYIGEKDIQTQMALPETVYSMNAYLGARPIAQCLDEGADIVITGRCADSSLALGPLVHALKWRWDDYDQLSSGSLAGHLIECGTQVTGGIFTDWMESDDWQNCGYPIADVAEDGSVIITKNEGTGGLISKGTVSEQLLYEIADPRAYILPDVVCDFTKVQLENVAQGIRVTGALGHPPTDSYKVSSTYMDGFKATCVAIIGGPNSVAKGRKTAQALIDRCRRIFKEKNLKDFQRVHIQMIGAEDLYGPHAKSPSPRDVAIWISVHHCDKKALQIFSMEIASSATGMSPGLSVMVGGRPKPTPLLRLHSFLVSKKQIEAKTQIDEDEEQLCIEPDCSQSAASYSYDDQPESKLTQLTRGCNSYRLEDLAFTRSGDKGDSCNIGVIARKASYLPYIQQALTAHTIAQYFKHLLPSDVDPVSCVKRYEVEGLNGLNFVLEQSLGGGGMASLRSDPQGKAYGQMLLDFQITNMPNIDSL